MRYDTKADGSITIAISPSVAATVVRLVSATSRWRQQQRRGELRAVEAKRAETKQYTDQRMVEMDNKLSKTKAS